jgi:hypothetical protein
MELLWNNIWQVNIEVLAEDYPTDNLFIINSIWNIQGMNPGFLGEN